MQEVVVNINVYFSYHRFVLLESASLRILHEIIHGYR
jgi:hypothetical protein